MALISNAVTHGSVTEEQLDEAFSADRRSVDVLSTDFDSSTEGSIGGDSSLWESSDRDDITGDESDEKSTQFSGSFSSDCYGEQAPDFDGQLQAISTETSDSGTEGDDEGPTPRYELRSRTKKQCKPSAKRARRDDTSDEEGSMPGGGSRQSKHGRGQASRGRGGGRAGRGGRGRGGRGRGGSTRGHGGRGQGRRRTTGGSDSFPANTTPIDIPDSKHKGSDDFCPLRESGPHVPTGSWSALNLFKLFFDTSIMDRILRCTYAYAESKKDSKKGRYKLFMKKRVGISHLFAFIGALILLGIHGVRNHRKAWSTARAQVLYRLRDLLTCQLFELIGTFIHVVTPAEEDAASGNPLRKIQPLVDHIKAKCFEFYQPRKEVCIDERMVKSKARCHFKQYMRNKPTKWGFKLWVLADMTGYTVDFDIYTGKSADKSDSGLSHDVVMRLVKPLAFQGYELYVDNFYSSPNLFVNLLDHGITATGTFRSNRRGLPPEVVALKLALEKSKAPRGTGYYYRDDKTGIVYCLWKDTRIVSVMSTCHPGHKSDTMVTRNCALPDGQRGTVEIPRPIPIEQYNRFMGGVDKSDQYLAYHNVLRKTVRYWKTLFYHMIDIAIVNAFVLYNHLALLSGCRPISENDFRDELVLQIIEEYGRQTTADI